MPARITDLPRLLGASPLKPVWLIAGAEHLLVMEAADRLRARARELGFAEREIHDVDHRFDWNELAMSGAAMSLFSTRRLIELRMPTGKVLNVKLPEKVEEGQQIRLKGQGHPSPMGGPPGDAIVTVKFERHKQFRRDGADLRVDVPITLYEAVLGGKVRVPTLDGSAELNLPASVNTAKALRLKGKGLHGAGDLYATLRVVLPEQADPDLESLMRFWRDQKPYKVRDN